MKKVKVLLAEAIGTFVLVFCACGVAAFTKGDLVPTALTFGLVIVAMAYSVGRVSGCHINPAVSFGCALSKRMSWADFGLYCAAQVVGGFVGAVGFFGVSKLTGKPLLGNACNGIGTLTASSAIGALIAEIVLTCIFVYVILNVTDSKSAETKNTAGIIIGLTLTLVHLLGINVTGTSVNPARSLATALGSLIFENGSTDALAQVWMFIVGPMAGAALAALLFKVLHCEKEAAKPAAKDTK